MSFQYTRSARRSRAPAWRSRKRSICGIAHRRDPGSRSASAGSPRGSAKAGGFQRASPEAPARARPGQRSGGARRASCPRSTAGAPPPASPRIRPSGCAGRDPPPCPARKTTGNSRPLALCSVSSDTCAPARPTGRCPKPAPRGPETPRSPRRARRLRRRRSSARPGSRAGSRRPGSRRIPTSLR